jgi:hypothetical protein
MEDSATWVIVAASDRLQEGEAIEVLLGDDVVAIWRSAGELFAPGRTFGQGRGGGWLRHLPLAWMALSLGRWVQ